MLLGQNTGRNIRHGRHMNAVQGSQFVLSFRPLFGTGCGYAFPCNLQGTVDLDGLSEDARNNYLYACAMVGRELAAPEIEPVQDD